MSEIRYLSEQDVSTEQIQEWVETFHRDGCLFLQDVLTPAHCAELRQDLEWALENNPNNLNGGNHTSTMHLSHRMFEHSQANLRLFDLEPIVSFAEALIPGECHVIHNNSFQTRPGGGITSWHQDDSPHYLVTEGEPPTNVKLPVLLFTANYYLTDVTEIEHGGTEVIPGSHLFGASPPNPIDGTEWEEKVQYNLGKAGVLLCSTIRCGTVEGQIRVSAPDTSHKSLMPVDWLGTNSIRS